MKFVWAGLAVLMLMGCNKPVDESQAEAIAYDAAADMTAGRFSEMNERIADLESKVRSLELENAGLRSDLAALKSASDWHKGNIDRLFANDRNFAERLGVPIQQ